MVSWKEERGSSIAGGSRNGGGTSLTTSKVWSTAVSVSSGWTARPRTSTSRRPARRARRRAATSRDTPQAGHETQLAQIDDDARRPALLDPAQLLVECVRVREVKLTAQRDVHGAGREPLERHPESLHLTVPTPDVLQPTPTIRPATRARSQTRAKRPIPCSPAQPTPPAPPAERKPPAAALFRQPRDSETRDRIASCSAWRRRLRAPAERGERTSWRTRSHAPDPSPRWWRSPACSRWRRPRARRWSTSRSRARRARSSMSRATTAPSAGAWTAGARPAVSPDGNWIAWIARDDGLDELRLQRAGGGATLIVVRSRRIDAVRFSPDSTIVGAVLSARRLRLYTLSQRHRRAGRLGLHPRLDVLAGLQGDRVGPRHRPRSRGARRHLRGGDRPRRRRRAASRAPRTRSIRCGARRASSSTVSAPGRAMRRSTTCGRSSPTAAACGASRA